VRANLTARGLPDARAVAAMRDGRRVRYAGLVICRQQPGTAQGITGTLRPQQGVVHLVADRLWKPQVGRAPASTPSRDFH
jgi:error-prone DNA polymerase